MFLFWVERRMLFLVGFIFASLTSGAELLQFTTSLFVVNTIVVYS